MGCKLCQGTILVQDRADVIESFGYALGRWLTPHGYYALTETTEQVSPLPYAAVLLDLLEAVHGKQMVLLLQG